LLPRADFLSLSLPIGLAAAGGLAMTSASTSFEQGTYIALRQISVAAGITMGTFRFYGLWQRGPGDGRERR